MDLMSAVVSLAKRRGFVYPSSEIYGGLANTWDYGPQGVELLRNIQNQWWEFFVHRREDMIGLDTNIFMNPQVWEASGHTASFTDCLVECKQCHVRTRADHLIENFYAQKGIEKKVEGLTPAELTKIITEEKISCPNCGEFNWTPARKFNLLFQTHIGIVPESQSLIYLRGELAQGMFVDFKQVLDSNRLTLPFGIAQIGKAFRNEITKGNFIFRTLQFNLAEFEYFFDPQSRPVGKLFEYWKKEMLEWVDLIGINRKNIRWRVHTDEERSHYSTRTEDIEYKFPFGYKELYGLAYRTDFDLKNHSQKSGVDLSYIDPVTNKKFIPHVLEPTFGMDRSLMVVLIEAYTEEKDRVVLKLKPALAPYTAAVFPLVKNKSDLVEKAKKVFGLLKMKFSTAWDDRGNIGKRYYSQDEIGTPWCVTIDYDTLEDDTVTVRDRDTTKQERVAIEKLVDYIGDKLLQC